MVHTALPNGRPTRHQCGMTLVELMVSITVGLILLAGLTALFLSQNRIQGQLANTGQMVESGRFAMQLIADDLQLAGYYGEHRPFDAVGGGLPPDPCTLNVATLPDDIKIHVQGYNNVTVTPTDTRPACFVNANIDVKNGTDMLVVRRVETMLVAVTPAHPAAGNQTYYLQASLCQDQANAVTIGQGNVFPRTQRDCATPANLRSLVVRIYFISPDNVLMRRELQPDGTFTNVSLADGIENLQIYYGRDTDGDNTADTFDNCAACTVANWGQVVAAQVYLLARNREPTTRHENQNRYILGTDVNFTPAGDDQAYPRHVFSEFVRIMNPSMR